MTWKRLEITRGEKNPKIYFSKGKAKYVRFSPKFLKDYELKDMKSVDILVDEKEKSKRVAFIFNEELEGILKLSKNPKTGTGYISASSLFNEIGLKDNRKLKDNSFLPKEENVEGKKAFVIEISKENLK